MYNYGNLSDTEFEALCKDIMEKKLGVKLRFFTAGRDGGIDICDSTTNPKIVIQVKHYLNSTFSNLKNSLKKEISNVINRKPEKYYVCTSLGLTPGNVRELYNQLSQIMDSDKNIIGKQDLEDLLSDIAYKDVLLKHYKLGLSLVCLSDLIYHDANIDNESLFEAMIEEEKYFVPTGIFYKVYDLLLKKRIVIITGKPGAGKTIMSHMLLLSMNRKGYRPIYVSDHNIKEIKALVSVDKSAKEFILLDDCFGQRYFELKSETGNELMSLIRYVRTNSNKILLMNTRISVCNEAQKMYYEFDENIENNVIKEENIDMDSVTDEEKAQIFYNHLYFNRMPDSYMEIIKHNKNYRNIVKHKNFMPRLIRRICMRNLIDKYTPDEYMKYAFFLLDNPAFIWRDEYENCMKLEDRIFVNTLFSLSDNAVLAEKHKRAFNNRIKNEGMDTTTDVWTSTKRRLHGNMINIIMKDKNEWLSVADPSVNDFLDKYLKDNVCEKETILKYATEYIQFERLGKEYFAVKVEDQSALKLNYANDIQKTYTILRTMADNKIKSGDYSQLVKAFFSKPKFYGATDDVICNVRLYIDLLDTQYKELYGSDEYINDMSVKALFDDVFSYYEDILNLIALSYGNWILLKYEATIKACIENAIAEYVEDCTIENYYTENPIRIIQEYTHLNDDEYVIDYEGAARDIFSMIIDNITEEVYDYIDKFPAPFNKFEGAGEIIKNNCNIDLDEVVSFLERSMEPHYDDEDLLFDEYRENNEAELDAVDRIFR